MRTSYSRLMAFLQCGEFYRHRYVLNTPHEQVLEEALLQGVLTHAGLEQILKHPQREREVILYEILPEWLRRDCRLDCTDEEVETIYSFALILARLFYRASARYRGEYEEPIRNKDGSIPKDLRNYPPASWVQVFKDNPEWAELRQNLDNWASSQQALFTRVSFSFLVGKCFDWILHFRYPEDFVETILVEYEFSPPERDEDLVPFGDGYFNGKIDWAYKNDRGELVVCDHKTSSNPPLPEDVVHSPQLLMYCYALHCLFGGWPERICIHHVPTGQFLVHPVDVAMVYRVRDYLWEIHQATQQQRFYRRLPTEYNSPCLRRDYRTQELVKTCPFLSYCWPEYAAKLATIPFLDQDVT